MLNSSPFGRTPKKRTGASHSTLHSPSAHTPQFLSHISPRNDLQSIVKPISYAHHLLSPQSRAPSAAQVSASLTSQSDQLTHTISTTNEAIQSHATFQQNPFTNFNQPDPLIALQNFNQVSTPLSPSLPTSNRLKRGLTQFEEHAAEISKDQTEDQHRLEAHRRKRQKYNADIEEIDNILQQKRAAAFSAQERVVETAQQTCSILRGGLFVIKLENHTPVVDTAAATAYASDPIVVCSGTPATPKQLEDFFTISPQQWLSAPRISSTHAFTVCNQVMERCNRIADDILEHRKHLRRVLDNLREASSVGEVLTGTDGRSYVLAEYPRRVQDKVAEIASLGRSDDAPGDGASDGATEQYLGDIPNLISRLGTPVSPNSVVSCGNSLLLNLNAHQLCLRLRGFAGLFDAAVRWPVGEVDIEALDKIVAALFNCDREGALTLVEAICRGLDAALDSIRDCGAVPMMQEEDSRNLWMRVYNSGSSLVNILRGKLSPIEEAPAEELATDASTRTGLERGSTCPKNQRCMSGPCRIRLGI